MQIKMFSRSHSSADADTFVQGCSSGRCLAFSKKGAFDIEELCCLKEDCQSHHGPRTIHLLGCNDVLHNSIPFTGAVIKKKANMNYGYEICFRPLL